MLLGPVCAVLSRWDGVAAASVAAGGLVAIVPQAYFAAQAFRFQGARAARVAAQSAYAGEMMKLLLSAVGFAAVFMLLRPLSATAVFAGYLGMLAVQITGSWWLLRQHSAGT